MDGTSAATPRSVARRKAAWPGVLDEAGGGWEAARALFDGVVFTRSILHEAILDEVILARSMIEHKA